MDFLSDLEYKPSCMKNSIFMVFYVFDQFSLRNSLWTSNGKDQATLGYLPSMIEEKKI